MAHDQNAIAGARFGCDALDQLVEIGFDAGPIAQRGEILARIPRQPAAIAVDEVGASQAVGKLRAHGAQLHGV